MRPALSDYRHLASGKVRELYGIDDEHLLFVATDRISAYDHILSSQIPDKGRILTAMSVFFFDLIRERTGAPITSPARPTIRGSPRRCSAAPLWYAGWRCCPSSAWRADTSPGRG